MLTFPRSVRKILPIQVLLLLSLGIVLLALSTLRQIGTYGVETDFYGSFVPEAQRLLAGKSLHLAWQPPFYPCVLAGVYLLVGDWFRSGLFISVCSAVFAVGAVYCLFRDLYDRVAAWGAAFGLVVWPPFLEYSLTASSDVLFLALMMVSLAVAVGGETLTNRRTFLAGLLAGLASLTRTNGITLAFVALACGSRALAGSKLKTFSVALGGVIFPWFLWFITSQLLNSPVFPTDNYIDVVSTFYLGWSDESRNLAREQFSSIFDVILFDPQTLIRGFLHNTAIHFWKNVGFGRVSVLFSLPLFCISFLGLFWLLIQKMNGVRLAFWLVYVSQYALLALRAFRGRYYIFLAPAFFAGIFSFGKFLIDRAGGIQGRKKVAMSLALGVVLLSITAYNGRYITQRLINETPTEVIEAGALLKKISSGSERIIARKPHIGFYTGLGSGIIPLVQSEEELYKRLCSEKPQQKAFLFFGRMESVHRPGLRSLRTPSNAPDWLLLVGHGEPVGSSWVLYQVQCVP